MAENISQDQSKLPQYLQLLYQVHSANPMASCLDIPKLGIRDNNAQKIIPILDTIAVALTTGKPGEVFAVGLDETSGYKLILAKNEPHTEEDDQAVCRLLDVLKKTKTEDGVVAKYVLPFLLSRCKENIKKRVKKMVDVLAECEAEMEKIGPNYIPSSEREKEFPDSDFYFARKKLDKLESPPFVETMCNLWSDISKQAKAFLDLTEGSASVEDVRLSFTELAMFATVLENSPFLPWFCNHVKSSEPDTRQFDPEKLKRRLAKVCQYYQGILRLVKYTKRIPADSISYCWVSPITGTGEMTVHLDDHLSVISQILDPLPDETAVRVRKYFPQLERNWPSNRSIETCVHVEISLLLHRDSSPDPPDHTQSQPIGCSKRTCLCCTLWINAYNKSARTKWATGSFGGKSYAAWALPGHLHANDSTAVGRRTANGAVMRRVKRRVDHFFDELLSDEDQLF